MKHTAAWTTEDDAIITAQVRKLVYAFLRKPCNEYERRLERLSGITIIAGRQHILSSRILPKWDYDRQR